MRFSIQNFKLPYLWTTLLFIFLNLYLAPNVFAKTERSITRSMNYGFEINYPGNWKINLNPETDVQTIHGLPVLDYVELKNKNIEVRVYTLKNVENKTIDSFSLQTETDTKYFMKRFQKSINGLNILQAEYEYDPPKRDIVKNELEAMIELKRDKFLYMQIAAPNNVDRNDLLNTFNMVLSSVKPINLNYNLAESKIDFSSAITTRHNEPGSLKKGASHPYSILLASCRLEESAQIVYFNYKKLGLAPYIVKVELGHSNVWFRIFTGHYKTRKEALGVIKEYGLSDSLVLKTPYANLIGIFSSEDEATDALGFLQRLGYSPYFVEEAENSFLLVVGAFMKRKGADKQGLELQLDGIQNQIIKR